MNVRELIEVLEGMDPQAEVRMAHQPNYPLQFAVEGVATAEAVYADGDPDADPDEVPDEVPNVVWIVEGDHPDDSPYAPKAIWDVTEGGW